MSDKQFIDPNRVRSAFNRAAKDYDEAAVLQKEICKRMIENLSLVRIDPKIILDAGTGTGEAIVPLQTLYASSRLVNFDISEQMLSQSRKKSKWFRKTYQVCGNIEQLPLANNSIDLVFSNLTLQWCNDLPQTFKEIWRVLKPEGLFVFSTFGPDTLKELRQSWRAVDDQPHVNRFDDMHDIGDWLMASGFKDPVMESEMLTLQYDSVNFLMQDLRMIGANVTAQTKSKGLLTPKRLEAVTSAYERFRQDEMLPATYEVVYGHAWKPVVKINPIR